mmetsp:Transcript_13566/g.24412  ORF Transcript_13566/g.24412 Transcript_13566/m.24412 type:complete len:200 (-) Transcript_13566:493-1092(-)
MWEPRLQAVALALRKAINVPSRILPLESCDVGLSWCAEEIENHVQLVVLPPGVIAVVCLVLVVRRQREAGGAREEGSPVLRLGAFQHAQQLGIDAAHRPNVDGLGVAFLKQDQLRRSVPAGHHVAGEEPLQLLGVWNYRNRHLWVIWSAILSRSIGQSLEVRLLLLADGPRQPEVTNLHRAVLVHQAVCRLQIPVVDTC